MNVVAHTQTLLYNTEYGAHGIRTKTMSSDDLVDVTRRFDSGTETLQDIELCYDMFRSLFILLCDEMVSQPDVQIVIHKYKNLHGLCKTKHQHLRADLAEMGCLRLLDACVAVKIRADHVIHMLQIQYPQPTDSALQAAQWEVRIQKSMLKNQAQHGTFNRHLL